MPCERCGWWRCHDEVPVIPVVGVEVAASTNVSRRSSLALVIGVVVDGVAMGRLTVASFLGVEVIAGPKVRQ